MWKCTLVGLLPTLVVTALLGLVRDSIWPALLTYHAICLGIPIASKCYLKEAGFNLSNIKQWLLMTILLSFLLLIISFVVSQFINLNALLPEGWEILFNRIQPWRGFVIYSLLLNSFLEEYFWRGYLLPKTGLVQGAGLFWLLHAAAIILFIHPIPTLIVTLPVFAFGLLWGWMRQRFESILPGIIIHLFADIAILYAISHIMKL